MFGFGKKRKEGKKKSSIDKLIMGAIVGGAVGSVIGMSIAPQKGRETRDYLAQKGKELVHKGQEVTKLEKAIGEKSKESGRRFFGRLRDRIFRKKKTQSQVLDHDDLFRKIPNEVE